MLGVCAKDPTYCCTSSNQFSFSARLNHFLIEVLWRLVPALSLEQDGMVSRWVKHLETDRGRFSNKRLREILRERERDKCSKSSILVTILWSIWDEIGVRPEMRHRWWAFTTVVITAAVKSNMRSSYTLGENGRETAEFGAGSDPPKTQLGGNLFSAKIFLTPFLFLWNRGLEQET